MKTLIEEANNNSLMGTGKPSVIDLCLSATGIGDSICGFYAACGLAERLKNQGIEKSVRLHTGHPRWFARVSHPGVEVVEGTGIGIDMNRDYARQLQNADDRKQWYCDAIAESLSERLGVEHFTALAPQHVDNAVHGLFDLPDSPYVLVSPFSNYKTREWADSHWRYLTFLLEQNGIRVVAIGSAHHGETLQELFGDTATIWFNGQSEDRIAELLCGAKCHIGIDSGLSHFAGLLRVPAIAIHSHLPEKLLWSKTDIISLTPEQGKTCAPCRFAGGAYVAHCDKGCSAMANVSPQMALHRVLELGGDA